MPTSVKIDFLVPGFSKCGTTTLCALLDSHPGLYIPAIKEPWYFSSPRFEQQHVDYDNHFACAETGQLKGEGSVSYSGAEYEDVAVERIHANNADCRFIFIARNPRQRIESSYREMHHSGVQYGFNAPFSLGECMREFPQMVNDSLYWRRISRYRERFGDDSILVVFLEDLQKSPGAVLNKCFHHLGLDPLQYPAKIEAKLNAGEAKLYDTRILRYLRTNPRTGFKLARISPPRQDWFLRPLCLRRPFGKRPIVWDDESLGLLEENIVPDAGKFLAYCDRSLSSWALERKT
jgi:hypothetical protein